MSLRFGVGAGEVREVGAADDVPVQDGSAWWLAREAIDSAHAAQDAGLDFVRTRVRLGVDALDGAACSGGWRSGECQNSSRGMV